jgi:hypothetical protein
MRNSVVVKLLACTAIAMILPTNSASAARFESTSGRVGYHMDVGLPLFSKSDVPKGNKGGPITGTCQLATWNSAYSGSLPPGLKFVAGPDSDSVFSGTPRQAGSWRGTYSFDSRCTGGPDTGLYHRSIPVVFNIEP